MEAQKNNFHKYLYICEYMVSQKNMSDEYVQIC